jgi:hypothetical protein
MKPDLTNSILTFVLGVFAIASVILVLRTVMQTRTLQAMTAQATYESGYLAGAQGILNEVEAYNKKNPSPELTKLVQTFQAKVANAK